MPLHGPFTGLSRPHLLPKKLRVFSTGTFFVEAAIAFLFVSGPVYLYQTSTSFEFWHSKFGFSPVTAGLLGLSLFYLIQRIGSILFMPVVQQTIRNFGFIPTLIIGCVSYIFKFGSFLLFPAYPWLIPIVALLSGYGLMAFWISSLTFLTSEVQLGSAGKEIGSYEFVSRLAQIISPLLGALLAVRFGFTAPLMIAVFFFLIAAVNFHQLPNFTTKAVWRLPDYFTWVRQKNTLSVNLAMGAFQWERFGTSVLWPVFLFLTFQRQEAVGYILSGATFISLMFVYISGWMFDRYPEDKWWRLSTGGVSSFLWIPRLLLIKTPLYLVLNDAVDRVVKGAYSTVFFALTVLTARREKVYEFLVHREITLSLATILMLSIFCLILVVGWPWELIFATFVGASALSLIFPVARSKDPGK